MKTKTKKDGYTKLIKQYFVRNYYQDFPQNPESQRRLVKLFYPRLYAQGKDNRVPTESACRERIYQVARKIWKEIQRIDFSDLPLEQRMLLDSELKFVKTGSKDIGEIVGKYLEANWENQDFVNAFREMIDDPAYIGHRLRN